MISLIIYLIRNRGHQKKVLKENNKKILKVTAGARYLFYTSSSMDLVKETQHKNTVYLSV